MDETKDEYENKDFEYLIDMVGATSKLNIAIFIMCSFSGFLTALGSFSYGFLGNTPEFWCYDNHIQSSNWTVEQKENMSKPYGESKNGYCEIYNVDFEEISHLPFEEAKEELDRILLVKNDTVKCEKHFFNSDIHSTVTDWDLVCDRRWLYSSTQGAIHIGLLLGSTIVGYSVDKFGRKTMFNICTVALLLIGGTAAASPNVTVYIILKTIGSMFQLGIFLAGFVLCIELSSVKLRSFTGNVYAAPWALGIMILPGVAYLIPDWYYLQLAITTPTLFLIFSIWLLPESPRYLILNGKYTEAHKVLKRIAKSSNRTIPEEHKLRKLFEAIRLKGNLDIYEERTLWKRMQKTAKDAIHIMIDKRFRKRTFLVFYCWLSGSLVYYGTTLGSPSPEGLVNPYLYVTLGGVIEVISYISLWPISYYIGRKKSLILYFSSCSVCILTAMVLIIYGKNGEYVVYQWILYLTGKFAITSAFQLIWLFTSEMYPTKFRSIAVGNASTVARIGGSFSSYINDLLSLVYPWAPSAVFGVLSAVAAAFVLMLPETSDVNLPESITMEEDEMLKT